MLLIKLLHGFSHEVNVGELTVDRILAGLGYLSASGCSQVSCGLDD